MAKTTAGPDGAFTIRVPKVQPYDGFGSSGNVAWIAAEADRFGAQWQQWQPDTDAAKELVLKLVPESPIHGRIVDLEGKPVRDVQVQLVWQEAPTEGIVAWLEAVKSGAGVGEHSLGRGLEMPAYDDESELPAVTDQEGRFTFRGVGADRVARIELRGETIAYSELDVVTRAIPPTLRKDVFGATGEVFGADFTYQAAPTRPIVGTVRDAASGAPLAGVSIESRRLAGAPRAPVGILRTVTDAQGKYRLVGMAKGNGRGRDEDNAIAVVPNDDQPYFMLNWFKVPDPPGLSPTTLDFKLTRGVWVTGRVTDNATGAPVVPSRRRSDLDQPN